MNYAKDFCNAFEAIIEAIDSIKSDFEKTKLIKFHYNLCELKKIHTLAIEKSVESKITKVFEEKIKNYESKFEDLKAKNKALYSKVFFKSKI
jgi:hypothetical protein